MLLKIYFSSSLIYYLFLVRSHNSQILCGSKVDTRTIHSYIKSTLGYILVIIYLTLRKLEAELATNDDPKTLNYMSFKQDLILKNHPNRRM